MKLTMTLDELAQRGFLVEHHFRKSRHLRMSRQDDKAIEARVADGVGRDFTNAKLALWPKSFFSDLNRLKAEWSEYVLDNTSWFPDVQDPDDLAEELAARGPRKAKTPPRRGGSRLLLHDKFHSFCKEADKFKKKFEAELLRLDALLPSTKVLLKQKHVGLGPDEFNEDDYPEKISTEMVWGWSYKPLPNSVFMSRILPEEEVRAWEGKYVATIQSATRAEFAEVIAAPMEALLDALSRDKEETGKNARISDDLFGNVKSAFESAIKNDPFGGEILKGLYDRIRGELLLDNPSVVKSNPAVKARVKKSTAGGIAEIMSILK